MTTVNPVRTALLLGRGVRRLRRGARPLDDAAQHLRGPLGLAGSERADEALVDLREVFVVHPLRGRWRRRPARTNPQRRARRALRRSRAERRRQSTLVRVVGGLERPSAGRAVVDGLDGSGAPWHVVARHRRAWSGTPISATARALAGPRRRGARRASRSAFAASPARSDLAARGRLLERVDLLDRADARPSSPLRRRAAADRAAPPSRPRPPSSSPTSRRASPDEATAQHVLDLLAALAREEGRGGSAVVSHDPASASIADRVVHVRDGRVGEERTGDEDMIVIGRGGWLHVPEESLGPPASASADRPRPSRCRRASPVSLRRGCAAVVYEAPPTAAASRRGAWCRPAVHGPLLGGLRRALRRGRSRPSRGRRARQVDALGPAGLDTPTRADRRRRRVLALDATADAAFPSRRIGVIGRCPGSRACSPRERSSCADAPVRSTASRRARAMDALAIVGLADSSARGGPSVGRRAGRGAARRSPRPVLARRRRPTAQPRQPATLAVAGLLADLAQASTVTVICAGHDPIVVMSRAPRRRFGEAPPLRST